MAGQENAKQESDVFAELVEQLGEKIASGLAKGVEEAGLFESLAELIQNLNARVAELEGEVQQLKEQKESAPAAPAKVAPKASVAFLGIGAVDERAPLMLDGFLTPSEIAALIATSTPAPPPSGSAATGTRPTRPSPRSRGSAVSRATSGSPVRRSIV